MTDTPWRLRDLVGMDGDTFLGSVIAARRSHTHHSSNDYRGLLDDFDLSDARGLYERVKDTIVEVVFPTPTHARETGVAASWTSHEMADGAMAYAFLQQGFTTCHRNVETVLPAVAEMAQSLRDALKLGKGTRVVCNMYSSLHGSGAPMHYDSVETLVVQVCGEKRWRHAPAAGVYEPFDNFIYRSRVAGDGYAQYVMGKAIKPPREQDLQDVTLVPGSVLYLPAGTWHCTSTAEASVSLTFGIHFPRWYRVMSDALEVALQRHAEFRRPAFELHAEATPTSARDEIARRLRALADVVAGLEPEQVFAAFPKADFEVGCEFGRKFRRPDAFAVRFEGELALATTADGEEVELELDAQTGLVLKWIGQQSAAFSAVDVPEDVRGERDVEDLVHLFHLLNESKIIEDDGLIAG